MMTPSGTPTPGTPTVQDINILDPGQIPTGKTGMMAAVAVDQNGRPLPSVRPDTWCLCKRDLLVFTNTATGAYTAGSTAGPDFVTATATVTERDPRGHL